MKGASAVGRCMYWYLCSLDMFCIYNTSEIWRIQWSLDELPEKYDSMGNMPTQRIVAWIVGGCISTAVMQAVLQPLLSAKSPEAARVGSYPGYVIAAPICFFTAICGMLSKASGADLGDGSTAFAYAIKTFSSPVFAGITFCICNYDHCSDNGNDDVGNGTIITNVYKTEINPDVDDAKVLKLSKRLCFVFAYLTLIPAFLILSKSLTNLFLTLQHVAAAPVSFSILAGLLWKKRQQNKVHSGAC